MYLVFCFASEVKPKAIKVSVERDASTDVSCDSSEERVKPISIDPLNSKETKDSLSGMESEFEFVIASSSNEEMDSQPFVDCSLSEERDPQFESMDVYQEVALKYSQSIFVIILTKSYF
ncbi:hypothetical protein AMTRI_Chr09g38070 [Amborella trichopoda]